MKLNKEKAAALLAAVILAFSLWSVAQGILAPRRPMHVDVNLPSYPSQLIPRKFRTYRLEGRPSRNPFAISEGWRGMETTPLPPPPLPPLPRPVPSLGAGPTSRTAGFRFEASLPSPLQAGGKAKKGGGS